ncbi:GNAT family N-acetyltransferase [Collimonas sp.]|jgi:GNAT superfamily N-acetyltransferase|uniref:GNAT family N-acetyltransferase n=1 Tax=Collimonas sp. TaxID=1963772 RepID=UPI002BE2AC8E|nr:GNAT family N-acetyltransferase [Collimonas sp.]HWW06423.1 GNAT family N-acetyltransferase [Collimonas sp.]
MTATDAKAGSVSEAPGKTGGTSSDKTKASRPTIFVKELSRRARKRLLRHFLALSSGDRLLRFGSVLSDDLLSRYVENIDFSRDTVFGVYDRKLRLLGVGHLAFAPREALPSVSASTSKERVAEFGVSVAASARGMGVGSRLFERAAIHCRNVDIDTLYVHCLASNKVMMHIAKKAGMAIHRDYGEADAYLKLPPANPASVLQEAVQEQVATLDYTVKANLRAALKWLSSLPGIKRD